MDRFLPWQWILHHDFPVLAKVSDLCFLVKGPQWMVLIQCRDTRSSEPQVRCECYINCAVFKEILCDPEGGDQPSQDRARAEGLRVIIIM